MLSKFLVSLLLMFPVYAAKSDTHKIISLNPSNTVVFRGTVMGESTTAAQLELARLIVKRGKGTYPIYLVMDSPGGSIIAGESFIQFAKTLQNVHTISIFAASMASAIVESIPGKRYVTENGVMMFHRARGTFEGQFEDGEIEQELALFKEIVRGMEQRNANRLKLDIKVYKDKVKDELWLTGPSSIEQNAADEIIDIVCTPELIEVQIPVLTETIFGAIAQTFSGCPLFRGPLPQKPQEEE